MKEDNRQDLVNLVYTGQLSGRIAVLEGEPLINVLNQDYHSPYYYIGMCRRGESHGYYNYRQCSQQAGEICWLQPNHVISHSYISPDYEAISVFIPKDYLEQLKQAGALGRCQYLLHTPILKLTPEQFDTLSLQSIATQSHKSRKLDEELTTQDCILTFVVVRKNRSAEKGNLN